MSVIVFEVMKWRVRIIIFDIMKWRMRIIVLKLYRKINENYWNWINE